MANICQKCGVTGRSDHLIHGNSCKTAAEHRYCLDNMPNDDKLQVHWLCELCKARIHKLAFPRKLKGRRSTRIPERKYRKIKHADICRDKYGFIESSGSFESMERPSSSNVASALAVDWPGAGLLRKEIQNVAHSSNKCVEDEKPRTHRRRLILAKEEEVDDENFRHSYRKIKRADIGRDKYGFTERSGSYESRERPSSSNVASALEIDRPGAGLPQKEIQNVVHSSIKWVKDEKPRTHRRRLILAKEEEVDEENCRHSSSKVIVDENPKRKHRRLNLTEDKLDEVVPFSCVDQKVHSESNLQANGPLLSPENALDIAIKSKIQIIAADKAMDKLHNCSLETSKSQAMMQTETHDTGRNISGHQKFIDHQSYELARPVVNHVWRGFFEILNEAYGPIRAHLSDRACEKVCITSAILPPVLQMVKLSKLDAWPRSFENSPPTGDNIALYFFPDDKRAKSMLDHLIWDVIDKKLVLKVVLDETELLVFPSIILPEVYHGFQGHYYLWGAFKGRQVQKISSAPSSCCFTANEIPTREKIQDLEHAEEHINSHHQKSVIVGVAKEKQIVDDSEPSGEMEKVEALYKKPSDVVENEKLDEEKQKADDSNDTEGEEEVKVCDENTSNITVDSNAADLSNHLVIFGKKIPLTSMPHDCPSEDIKMEKWEQGREREENQLHHESTENILLLFPLQAENMASKSTIGEGTELDLVLRLGLPAGDNGC